jgi:serine/threonine protein kinase
MTPVAECNLWEFYNIAANCRDKLTLLRSFFGCLATALQYIHSIKIRHRDIKPANNLVKGDKVFLTDFGISLDFEMLSGSTTTADSGKTQTYAAPEVVRYEPRGRAADIWSLGCVFLEMLVALKGGTVSEMRTFFEEKSEGLHWFHANIPQFQSWAQVLVKMGNKRDRLVFRWIPKMLVEDAASRLTIEEVVDIIMSVSREEHILYMGPCCFDEGESTEVDEDDDELVWEE